MNMMKKLAVGMAGIFAIQLGAAAAEVDSTALFFYNIDERSGYRVAVAADGGGMEELGQLFTSDYGPWGAEKKMYAPSMTRLPDGRFVVVFQLNSVAPCFAVTVSDNLIQWRPQDYPVMTAKGCLEPVVEPGANGGVEVFFRSADGTYRKTVSDAAVRHFSRDVAVSEADYLKALCRDSARVGDRLLTGRMMKVTKSQYRALADYTAQQHRNGQLWAENLKGDSRLLPLLRPVEQAVLNIKAGHEKAISDKLIGVFFEDISYAADGGLYAELVQNRDFEYNSRDRKEWTASTAWRTVAGKQLTIATDYPLSQNNPHYVVMDSDTLYNEGWDGIVVRKGERYDFSVFSRSLDGCRKQLLVELVADGQVIAAKTLKLSDSREWTKVEATLKATASSDKAELRLTPRGKGRVAADMVSLFPRETFMGRKNGLRKNLAQAIADLKPKFIRFPGGCMSHGNGIDNIYHWYHTIGSLMDRKPDSNIWHYHQTRGLGFYEYFQYCEDIGAEPLPVLAAGVPCQNSGANADGLAGQQNGIDMKDMPDYVQEFLDLIEWANGDPTTSEWAKMRADAGHPEPFHLKYVGVGNEDLISTVFEERCLMIAKAIKERYPDIEVCGTVGPFHYPSSDYVEGWRFADENRRYFDLVDEHYYESVGWFLNNQHYYDNYDRNGSKVYLGEYAARQGKGGLDCALAEAVHLCNIERNADIVTMTSYAPLLSKNGHSNWSPDMMYFSNTHIEKTPSYETQRLFSIYGGDRYVESTLQADSIVAHRVAASVVRDSKTGNVYLKVANVLPVPLRLVLSASQLDIAQSLSYEGFSGKPGSRTVTKEEGACAVRQDEGLYIELPAYSFRAIRLNN